MSRIGAVVKKLYANEMNSAAVDAEGSQGKRKGRIRRRLRGLKDAIASRRTLVWIIRIFAILIALVVVAETVYQYNLLVSWGTIVKARRADVDYELLRRQNLIPTLADAVSKYAAYEQGVFGYVSDARAKIMGSPGARQAQASNVLQKTLSSLMALAEQYPDLKATQPIQDLIKEAITTEDRIAEAKGKHNRACEVYNQYRTVFPGNVYAFIFRFEPLPFIGMEEDAMVPAMELNMTDGGKGIEETVEETVNVPGETLKTAEGAKE